MLAHNAHSVYFLKYHIAKSMLMPLFLLYSLRGCTDAPTTPLIEALQPYYKTKITITLYWVFCDTLHIHLATISIYVESQN